MSSNLCHKNGLHSAQGVKKLGEIFFFFRARVLHETRGFLFVTEIGAGQHPASRKIKNKNLSLAHNMNLLTPLGLDYLDYSAEGQKSTICLV